ncbi:MAG: repair protein SbcC/Rad50, partial [Acidimicrobiaceae bacterium]
MRPVRLELEGFTAFRTPTVVDFEGVDLFALTGATGSGKTSLLDAMVFALYGNVPRLADQRSVSPVIAQGMAEARVRLDFTIGSDAYTATRLVRRTKGGGGSTAEARLESGGQVLAGTADEVTAAVTERLGLSYEHFTKCVVLPQGEFARFLHDKPAARQDLLVSLLDLGVYAQMADLAGKRHAQAKSEAAVLDGRLSDLVTATPEAITAAAVRVDLLTALLDELDTATPELAALDAEAAAVTADALRVADETAVLASVRVPADLPALHDRLTAATELVEGTTVAAGAAEVAVASAEDALGALGDRAQLLRWLDAHDRGAGLRERRRKGQALVTERTADLAAASEVLIAADVAVEMTRVAEEAMAAAHRAHVVRADLVAGEECPVCLQTLRALPKVKAPPAMGKTRTARDNAIREQQGAADAQAAAARALAVAEAKLVDIAADLVEVDALLAGSPDRTEVQRVLEAHAKATADVDAARTALGQARAAQTDALADRDAAVADEHAARVAYDDARDALAILKPPSRR